MLFAERTIGQSIPFRKSRRVFLTPSLARNIQVAALSAVHLLCQIGNCHGRQYKARLSRPDHLEGDSHPSPAIDVPALAFNMRVALTL